MGHPSTTWSLIISNLQNVPSWTHGFLRAEEYSLDKISTILDHPDVQSGGLLHAQVEVHRIECAMQDYRAPDGELMRNKFGIPIGEVPPGYVELGHRVNKLRMGLLALTGDTHITHRYFWRFEPPGSRKFLSAMKNPYVKKEPLSDALAAEIS